MNENENENEITPAQKKRINTIWMQAIRQDRETLYSRMETSYGKRKMRDLTYHEASEFIEELSRLAEGLPLRGGITPAQIYAIQKISAELGYNELHLRNYIHKTAGAINLRNLTMPQARAILAGLNSIKARVHNTSQTRQKSEPD